MTSIGGGIQPQRNNLSVLLSLFSESFWMSPRMTIQPCVVWTCALFSWRPSSASPNTHFCWAASLRSRPNVTPTMHVSVRPRVGWSPIWSTSTWRLSRRAMASHGPSGHSDETAARTGRWSTSRCGRCRWRRWAGPEKTPASSWRDRSSSPSRRMVSGWGREARPSSSRMFRVCWWWGHSGWVRPQDQAPTLGHWEIRWRVVERAFKTESWFSSRAKAAGSSRCWESPSVWGTAWCRRIPTPRTHSRCLISDGSHLFSVPQTKLALSSGSIRLRGTLETWAPGGKDATLCPTSWSTQTRPAPENKHPPGFRFSDTVNNLESFNCKISQQQETHMRFQ